MRVLHTSDWHVGKTIRGHSRIDEHRAVLGEIVEVTEREQADVVLVVGDIFESAAPTAEAEQVAYEALLALRATGAHVVVVSGNHDHGPHLESLRPLFGAAGITVAGRVRPANDGGVVSIERNGETLRLALVPYVQPRLLVKIEQLLALDGAQVVGHYADRMHAIVGALCAPGDASDVVHMAAAHAFVRGGLLGGGERDAQTINEYGIEALAFPHHLHYVALGHLHRAQSLPAPVPTWYSGAPLAVDFGEQEDAKSVNVVDASPGRPATIRSIALERVTPLRTLTGTLEQIRALEGSTGDAWLRVRVTDGARAGLADEVRVWFPRAVEVHATRIDDETYRGDTRAKRHGRTPGELFREYLEHEAVADDRVSGLFDELLLDVETDAVGAG